MLNYSVHPEVYYTNANYKGLINMLEGIWVRKHEPGDGIFYIISGFANYNGGVRFFSIFENHLNAGGQVIAIFAGKTSQRLSSLQIVEKLLELGVEVHIVNRNRLLHMKCYGVSSDNENSLIVSSGNFTGPGMSQNVEASVIVTGDHFRDLDFSWDDLQRNILNQKWDYHRPTLDNRDTPAWRLLYDEIGGEIVLDDTQRSTLIITLSASDTSRIDGRIPVGTQYFWLSRYSYDFFPPLTILNRRGRKRTYSTIITMHYIDINETDENCRVTFEAENNLDFRIGTGKLKATGLVTAGDIAAISRIGESEYELRLFKQTTATYTLLREHAINHIGSRGKMYGYIENSEFERLANIRLNRR